MQEEEKILPKQRPPKIKVRVNEKLRIGLLHHLAMEGKCHQLQIKTWCVFLLAGKTKLLFIYWLALQKPLLFYLYWLVKKINTYCWLGSLFRTYLCWLALLSSYFVSQQR